MFNTDAGELIDGLGPHFRIAPVGKWEELTGFHVPYQVPHPFRTIVKERPIFLDALEKAKDAFIAAGAVLPIDISEDDILIQEYPLTGTVVFLFRRHVGIREMFVPVKYDLPPAAIAWLKATNRWSELTHH